MGSTSFITREIQMKTMMRFHYITTRLAQTKKINNTKCWQGHGTFGTQTQS